MAPPTDTSQPRLAAGCRWGGTEEERVILFPEGAIKLQGTGRQILERCDGTRTFADIIAQLENRIWLDGSGQDSRRHQHVSGAVAAQTNRGLLDRVSSNTEYAVTPCPLILSP